MTYISRPVIFLLLFFALKNISVLLAKRNSGELLCLATALIAFYGQKNEKKKKDVN